jgi:hypothetical protein
VTVGTIPKGKQAGHAGHAGHAFSSRMPAAPLRRVRIESTSPLTRRVLLGRQRRPMCPRRDRGRDHAQAQHHGSDRSDNFVPDLL